MQTIQLKDHASNNDPTARIVREQRGAVGFDWTIYAVRGGFVITFDHMTFDTVFASEQDAISAYDALVADRRAA
ncbi:hypothetical protein GCM10007908_03350 [Rhizobium albus]|nr:hypothetical protein GCM10007908_03350 [Rhizobium albus]